MEKKEENCFSILFFLSLNPGQEEEGKRGLSLRNAPCLYSIIWPHPDLIWEGRGEKKGSFHFFPETSCIFDSFRTLLEEERRRKKKS